MNAQANAAGCYTTEANDLGTRRDALMAHAMGQPLDELLARMLASWSAGAGVLPDFLGLGEAAFSAMLARHFPGLDPATFIQPGRPLDPLRSDEMDDLHCLLLGACSDRDGSGAWVVDILIAGCMGMDHLWQDLGLWSRDDLSQLIAICFPELAARNDRNMKWKKFLYKQMCETEGIYTCRAPSCDVCVSFAQCFGPEG